MRYWGMFYGIFGSVNCDYYYIDLGHYYYCAGSYHNSNNEGNADYLDDNNVIVVGNTDCNDSYPYCDLYFH